MPSTVTHSYFARDTLSKINTNIKKIIDEDFNTYISFSNGPDFFYSYSKYRVIGNMMHREKTGLYFKNVINYIKENNLKSNSEILGYLYGYITHYCLDSNIHPIVYYQTGRYIKGNKSRKKYKGKHALMEYTIDCYMIKTRYKDTINKFKVHNFCTPKINISDTLINLIIKCTNETYDINITRNIIIKSLKKQRRVYKYLRYDRFKIKKIIYKTLSFLTLNKIPELKIASYNSEYKKYLFYLNLDKKQWFNPVDKNEISTYSFIELYRKSLDDSSKLINEIDEVLNDKKDINDIFDKLNNSYLTGKNVDDKRKIKYFSY